MAIIYSYPPNSNILPTDILVCTSTVLVSGKPKNQTKSLSIANLSTYIITSPSNNLNQVLTNGNTSLLNAKIGELYLYDTTELEYGKIRLYDSGFSFYNNLGGVTNMISKEGIVFFPNANSASLLTTTITANRTYQLPNASGTIALTSDIPLITGYVPYTGATSDINIGSNSIYTSGGAKLWDDGTVEGTFFQFAGSFSSYINTNATVFQNWTLPDASGTIALTSDIPTAGVVSINGLMASAQSLVTANSGTNFSISSSGDTHTFNIPNAGVGISRGLVTDVVQSIEGAKTFIKDLRVNTLTIGKGGGNKAQNTAVGFQAILSNTTGDSITASGYQSLYSNTTGGNNTANGYQALFSNTTGEANTAIGAYSLYLNTTGTVNTAIGQAALSNNTTGFANTAIGQSSMSTNTTGSNNVAIGQFSLANNTTVSSSVAIGINSLASNTIGVNNTAVGSTSLTDNTTGNYNVALGNDTLQSNTTGTGNTAIGYGALIANTTGTYNSALGIESLNSNIDGTFNTAVGYQALKANTDGQYNNAFGWQSMLSNTGGRYNAAYGVETLKNNTTGRYNTAIGLSALNGNVSALDNTASGYAALGFTTTGGSNSAYGAYALRNNTTGIQNVGLGANCSLLNVTDSNSIVIGYNTTGAGSNTVTIGNGSITTTRLRGTVQGGSFVKDTGTAYETLKADGSVTTDGTLYKTTSTAYQVASGTSYFYSAVIPSNIFASGDNLKVNTVTATTVGATAAVITRYYINTTPSIVGATQIANWAGALGSVIYPMDRTYWVNGGNFYARNFTASSPNSSNTGAAAITSTPIPGGSFYIIVEIITTGTDLAGLLNFQILKT
jgi:hypothetical protein